MPELEDNFEKDELENSFKEEAIENPFSTKDIKITSANIVLPSLINKIKFNELEIPKFQRKADLWSKKQMSRLIESILLKLPLPIFYFDVTNPDKWIIVDGLQRISTIKKFFIDKDKPLKLTSLEFLTQLNGKTYDELDRSFKRTIEDTNLITYQIEAQTPKKVRYSIFNRINTGGISLNAQEVRQALNQDGKAVRFLEKICENDLFKKIVKIKSSRMLDRELVLRFLAFNLIDYQTFTFNNMGQLLDEAIERLDDIKSDDKLDILSKNFFDVLDLSELILGVGHGFSKSMAFENKTKTLNRSIFDVLTVCFNEIKDKDKFIKNKEIFKSKFIKLLRDENSELSKSVTEGTSGKVAIDKRLSIIRQLIKGILDEN
jgi:hypothetical protein